MKFWLEKGVAGLRLNSVNLLIEADKDMYGGQYPDEPLTGKQGLTEDDYGYLEHMYTKDQDEVYDLVGQFRDVFDAIAIRDNMTRYFTKTSLYILFYSLCFWKYIFWPCVRQ